MFNPSEGGGLQKLQGGAERLLKSDTNFYTMKNAVKNKLQMYQSVLKVIQSNQASWNGLVAFENAVTRFSQKVTELENLTYQKSKIIMGMRSKRDKKRDEIVEKALHLGNALYALASAIGDEKLKADVHYSPSRLRYAPITTFMQIVNGLINTANDLIADLADYGVDQNMVDDLTLAHMEFIEISNLPRQAIVSRKVLVQQIGNTVSEIDEVLKSQLDRLIVLLNSSAPGFVMTYEGARVIIDTPATRRSKSTGNDDLIDESESPPGENDNSP
ncbi:MAG: hypothetical protein R3277_10855 [Brumimicrobium sp.]|nr:hypothetical protein [Brumimicrobium sp.]